MPAKAGIQKYLKTLDSRLRGNDVIGRFKIFYETTNFRFQPCRWPQKFTRLRRVASLIE